MTVEQRIKDTDDDMAMSKGFVAIYDEDNDKIIIKNADIRDFWRYKIFVVGATEQEAIDALKRRLLDMARLYREFADKLEAAVANEGGDSDG